jgi:hypothetical protein
MRGFKPSYFQAATDMHADLEKTKEANLRRYVERVRAGLPLFDEKDKDEAVAGNYVADTTPPTV